MGQETMGKVLVAARIENLEDVFKVRQGELSEDRIRHVKVDDALIDNGATSLSLPSRLIQQLGLQPFRTRKAQTSAGMVTLQVYGPVRLTIQDRDCFTDFTEIPDECPVLIGQIPLEMLDFVVDLGGRRLIGNPEHGGEHIVELY
jgi:predicted aspartyl protease